MHSHSCCKLLHHCAASKSQVASGNQAVAVQLGLPFLLRVPQLCVRLTVSQFKATCASSSFRLNPLCKRAAEMDADSHVGRSASVKPAA